MLNARKCNHFALAKTGCLCVPNRQVVTFRSSFFFILCLMLTGYLMTIIDHLSTFLTSSGIQTKLREYFIFCRVASKIHRDCFHPNRHKPTATNFFQLLFVGHGVFVCMSMCVSV